MNNMRSYETKFSGRILERGFWIYVWKIEGHNKKAWYVGRTGDNSSPNAASPFGRLSQHLDLRRSASAAMLATNLQGVGMAPEKCEFALLAIGPIYPEQNSMDTHEPYRDAVARIEAELAYDLKERGLTVLGKHPRRGEYDKKIYKMVVSKVDEFLAKTD